MLKGTRKTAVLTLRAIGLPGAVLGVVCHFLTWITIDAGDKTVTMSGMEGLGIAGIALFALYGLLLVLDSVYVFIPLALLVPYTFESIWGTGLLRYMPLAETKLLAPLYLMLPTALLWALAGSFASVLSKTEGQGS